MWLHTVNITFLSSSTRSHCCPCPELPDLDVTNAHAFRRHALHFRERDASSSHSAYSPAECTLSNIRGLRWSGDVSTHRRALQALYRLSVR
ncbi:hypothetical protein F5880DRAFT_1585540 [Lentinula raphanica]|nr:hypothetical protein F5880DRAFT_1585540 [Lentinula raphanica]